jgi:hypothetical protein
MIQQEFNSRLGDFETKHTAEGPPIRDGERFIFPDGAWREVAFEGAWCSESHPQRNAYILRYHKLAFERAVAAFDKRRQQIAFIGQALANNHYVDFDIADAQAELEALATKAREAKAKFDEVTKRLEPPALPNRNLDTVARIEMLVNGMRI